MLSPAGLRMMTALIDFKHDVFGLQNALHAFTYDPARDSAIAYAARAGRDPNWVGDFIDEKWKRTGELLEPPYGSIR